MASSRALRALKRVPGWVWPLALGVVVFQPGTLLVGPDASWYWVLAKNLLNGVGYAGSEWMPEVRRGPGLALLLAGAFSVFGEDVSSAAWLMRALFVASAMVTYALGARWFGRGVGVVGACGLLTDPIANAIGFSLSIDITGVLFALLAVLSLEGRGWRATAGAALALAAVAMTKEAALVVVAPLAVHALLGDDRRLRLTQLAVAVGAAVFVLISWNLWAGGGAQVVGRVMSFLPSGESGGGSSVVNYAAGLWSFATGTAEGSWAWPVLVGGWLAVGIRAARGGSRERLLLLLVLSLVPVMVLQGRYNLRPGQSYMLFPLAYLALGRAVQLLAQRYAPAYTAGSLAALAAVLVALSFATAYPSTWLRRIYLSSANASIVPIWNPLSIPPGEPRPRGWLNKVVDEADAWLAENTAPEENIVSDWYWADALYLRSDGKRPIHRIPYVRSRDVGHMALETAEPLPEVSSLPPILFVFSQSNRTDPRHPDAWVNALSEPLLFARLEQVRADWVIVTKRRLMIADYFDANPSFELAYVGYAELLRIYRVRRPLRATPFETGLKAELGVYLDRLEGASPAAYDRLASSYFAGKLGVGGAELVEWRDALRRASAREPAATD